MRMPIFVSLCLVFALGCRSVQSVSLTQIPAQRDKVVKAEVSKFVFFGLNFDNDFVDGLVGKLKDQCAGGQIKGILTKDETINYFLMLAYTREVSAQGFCIAGNGNGKGKLSSADLEPRL